MGNEGIRYNRAKFSTRLQDDRLYTAGHAWLRPEGENIWHVGLTKFALRMLGEAVEMEFEVKAGDQVETGQAVGWLEGFKAVTDIYTPIQGVFRGANRKLLEDLELLKRDPYGNGWLFELEGKIDDSCVDMHGYVAVLDATIDKMLGKRHE